MNEFNEKYLQNVVDIRVSNVDKKIYPNKSLVKLCNYMDAYSNDYISSKISFTTGSADLNEIQKFGLKIDDVLITKDSETPEDIAVSSVVIEDLNNVVCGYHLAILRPNRDELDGKYLMFKLKSDELKRYFLSVAKGSTRFGLTIGDLENAKIKFPSLSTQQQIAKILSTADAVIEKTQAAIAKYKDIKQGMLQDLFTRGVVSEKVKVKSEKGEWIEKEIWKLRPRYEDAPHLYKESKLGMIPREWEEKSIESIGEIVTGSTPPTARAEYYGDEFLFVSPADIQDNFFIHETGKKLTQSGFDVTRKLPENSICVVCIGSTIGKMALLAKEGCTNQQINSVICFDPELSFYFFYAMMLYNEPQFRREAGLQAVPIVNKSQFSEFLLPVAEKKEALKIAERLLAIDNKLQTEQTYLQKMQSLKKGLMEDLLSGKKQVPVLSGAEGKVQEELIKQNEN